MEDNQKINITPQLNDKGESVLVIRKGEAEKLNVPVKVIIEGTINTPADWLEDHMDQNYDKAYALFNLNKRSITYRAFPDYVYGSEVRGFLRESRQLERLKINHATTYNAAGLAKHLKTVTSLAEAKSDHMAVIGKLETLKLKVSKAIEKEKDEKGNVKLDFNQIVESNLIFDLKFRVPYFEREEVQTVAAVIVIEEVSQNDVVLTLQNYELPDLMDQEALKYLDREAERFKKARGKTIKEGTDTPTIIWEN